MKKVILTLVAILGLGFAVTAQTSNAIGVRGAFGDKYGAELSYQQALGSNNRLEMDLGWYNAHDYGDYINLTGIYQWVWNIQGGLNWYAGLGANVGLWTGQNDDNIGVGFDGQIGIEYDFDIPFQISLDARPQWDVLGASSGFGYGAALGIRYRF